MNNSKHSKVTLAILFAGGMLNSSAPALSANQSAPANSLKLEIANNKQLTPALRAYKMLRFASQRLGDHRMYTYINSSQMNDPSFINTWQSFLISWTNQLSYANHELQADKQSVSNAKSKPTKKEDEKLAHAAIKEALEELKASSDTFAKLDLYYVASLLYERTGNSSGKAKCNHFLKAAFKSCEETSPADENAINAASTILNASAYEFIQVKIDDQPRTARTLRRQSARISVRPEVVMAESFTDSDFKKSEGLKLRAIKMVDRLNSMSHVRRKAHRDLALWYSQLGMTAKSDEQKDILYELVGVKDDSILYPQPGYCGSADTWWLTSGIGFGTLIGCGMG